MSDPQNHNRLKTVAHSRLGELVQRAEQKKLYGTVTIVLSFEGGQVTTIQHSIKSTEK